MPPALEKSTGVCGCDPGKLSTLSRLASVGGRGLLSGLFVRGSTRGSLRAADSCQGFQSRFSLPPFLIENRLC